MQGKLVRYSKGPNQSFIIAANQEQNWKQNFSKTAGNDISSYDREEADYFQVSGEVIAESLTEQNQTSQHSGGRQTA